MISSDNNPILVYFLLSLCLHLSLFFENNDPVSHLPGNSPPSSHDNRILGKEEFKHIVNQTVTVRVFNRDVYQKKYIHMKKNGRKFVEYERAHPDVGWSLITEHYREAKVYGVGR